MMNLVSEVLCSYSYIGMYVRSTAVVARPHYTSVLVDDQTWHLCCRYLLVPRGFMFVPDIRCDTLLRVISRGTDECIHVYTVLILQLYGRHG